MRLKTQTTSMGWFFLRPRVRIYRRPLLIWIRWLDRSFFIDTQPSSHGAKVRSCDNLSGEVK